MLVLNSTTEAWNDKTQNKSAQYSNNISKIRIDVNNNVNTSQDFRQECPVPTLYRRIRVCDYNYNAAAWFGLAQIYGNANNGHIHHARVKFDNADNGTTDEDGKRHIVCMEIGHVLGLDHWNTSGNNSCMNEGFLNNADYDQPAQHDYNQVDNQTHHHGGSGANLDVGDPLNGDRVDCRTDVCTTASSHVRPNGEFVITYAVWPAELFAAWNGFWPFWEKGLAK